MLLPRRRARSMGLAYPVDVLAVDAIARGYVGTCFDGGVHVGVGVPLALQIMHISGFSATAIERGLSSATPSKYLLLFVLTPLHAGFAEGVLFHCSLQVTAIHVAPIYRPTDVLNQCTNGPIIGVR